jgi:hypothetical protein
VSRIRALPSAAAPAVDRCRLSRRERSYSRRAALVDWDDVFSDPTAAFANIAAALRLDAPGEDRLAATRAQRWARAIDAALGNAAQPRQPGADPFSLGDAEATAGTLEGVGFDGVRLEDVHEPAFLVEHGPATPLDI